MRKRQGYAISDHIKLDIKGELATEWKEFLAKQALAELVDIKNEEADAITEEIIEGRQFRIAILRRNNQ
jgi:hypothetical protein